MNDLDTMLRDALHTDAERAPSMPPEWAGPATATIVPIATRRPTRRIAVAAAGLATAAAVVGVLALVTRPDDPTVRVPATEPVPTPWQPPGTEFPLTDEGPATSAPMPPTIASLARSVKVEGHPPIAVAPAIFYMRESTAVEMWCASGGCAPKWYAEPSVGITSSIDNGEASFDLWMWDNVPVEAAYVSYQDGDLTMWQRPIARVAAFPDVDGNVEVVVAYDAQGLELGRVDDTTRARQGTAGSDRVFYDIPQDQGQELVDLTTASMTACLTERGGVIDGGGIATFAPGVDDVAIWDECVLMVKDVVGARFTEMAPAVQAD